MKLTSQQKLLAGVLGLGLAALFVDQLFLAPSSGDEDSTAAPDHAASLPEGEQPELAVPPSPPESVSSDLGRRISRAASEHGVDALDCPDPMAAPAQEAAGLEATIPVEEAEANPLHDLRLKSVLGGSRGVAVLVHGDSGERLPVHIGETVRGCTLVEVDHLSAIFEHEGVRYRLRLPRALAQEDDG